MVLKPIRRQPGYRDVFESLERSILNGDLAPGDLLPTEAELCDLLHVNRTTVREGIRLLEDTGLIARTRQRRLEVIRPSVKNAATSANRAIRLNNISFRELWEVTLELEALSARLAAERISDRQLRDLAAIHDAMVKGIADGTSLGAVEDTAFHDKLAEASGNRILQMNREIFVGLHDTAIPAVLSRVPVAPGRQRDIHGVILAALQRRDPAAAEAAMRKHILDFRRGFEIMQLDMELPVMQVLGKL